MKHTIVLMDSNGNTIGNFVELSDWSDAVKVCGALNELLEVEYQLEDEFVVYRHAEVVSE